MRWRYGRLCAVQRKGHSITKSVLAWYRRSCAHLSAPVVQLLDGMLTIDPQLRMTMEAVLAHPWCRDQ